VLVSSTPTLSPRPTPVLVTTTGFLRLWDWTRSRSCRRTQFRADPALTTSTTSSAALVAGEWANTRRAVTSGVGLDTVVRKGESSWPIHIPFHRSHMLLTHWTREPPSPSVTAALRRRSQSVVNAFARQEVHMSTAKRERWTESEVDALPAGEHDYFDRKSGQLFNGDKTELLATLAKAISAFANSGGGHLVLGVDDAGVPDGIPPTVGRTPIRVWLEQQIPNLVDYALADFRVHVVERGDSSRISLGRDVVIIDVGDSALAPHQCQRDGQHSRKGIYYYRQAGHSVAAPHFYLELLRQRLVAPSLEATGVHIYPVKAARVEGGYFLATRMRFVLNNGGRVAAYKWALIIESISGHQSDRLADYRFSPSEYPPGWNQDSSIQLDETILPGCTYLAHKDLGLMLHPQGDSLFEMQREIEALVSTAVLGYRIATETSPGEPKELALGTVTGRDALAPFARAQIT